MAAGVRAMAPARIMVPSKVIFETAVFRCIVISFRPDLGNICAESNRIFRRPAQVNGKTSSMPLMLMVHCKDRLKPRQRFYIDCYKDRKVMRLGGMTGFEPATPCSRSIGVRSAPLHPPVCLRRPNRSATRTDEER